MTTEIEKADKQTTLTDLAERIKAAHAKVVWGARTNIETAMQCGDLLIAAKAQLKHGQWLPWLKENFGLHLDVRTAQVYMRLAHNREHIFAQGTAFIDGALFMGAPYTIEDFLAKIVSPVKKAMTEARREEKEEDRVWREEEQARGERKRPATKIERIASMLAKLSDAEWQHLRDKEDRRREGATAALLRPVTIRQHPSIQRAACNAGQRVTCNAAGGGV
jgi:hypothetical protein